MEPGREKKMNKIIEMKKLVEELNNASDAYYNGKEVLMSDTEFDLKLKHLEELEKELHTVLANSPTVNVGAPVLNTLEKVKHEHKPMLSLAKVHSAEEVVKFANGKDIVAMVKLDGLSCRLTYEDGNLVKAETRGDGEIGNLITDHAKQFKNIPLKINKLGTYVIDGEAIITDEDFAAINDALPKGTEKYKNSRNLASGTLALLDTSVVKERKITFVAWDVIVGSDENSLIGKLNEAKYLNFTTVDCYGFMTSELSIAAIDKCNDHVLTVAKEYGWGCDGVVWKFVDVSYGESLGRTEHHFNLGCAWKPELVEYETELIDIEWSCSKNYINPVAIFKPTIVNGNTIERASCHNVNYVEDLELGIGDKITIYLANEIIPQINKNLTRSNTFKIPECCPVCKSKTKIIYGNDDTKTLVCTNDMCQSKLLGRLKTFVSKNGMDISGLSEATLELLLNRNYISCFKDLYHLEAYKKELSAVSGFGAKSVSKLLKAIDESRKTTLEKFLAALSIPNVGRSTAKDIATYCKGDIDNFIFIVNNTILEFMTIDGIGTTVIESLDDWWKENKEMFYSLLEELNIEVPVEKTNASNANKVDLQNATFCITGKLVHYANRDALVKEIESFNGKYVSSVSTKTNYLINNDKTSMSGKNKKAVEVGCKVISEADFMQMCHIVDVVID